MITLAYLNMSLHYNKLIFYDTFFNQKILEKDACQDLNYKTIDKLFQSYTFSKLNINNTIGVILKYILALYNGTEWGARF